MCVCVCEGVCEGGSVCVCVCEGVCEGGSVCEGVREGVCVSLQTHTQFKQFSDEAYVSK